MKARACVTSTCVNSSERISKLRACSCRPAPQGVGGWRGEVLVASFGDGHLLGACGANDEGDAGDGCNLPRSYQQSSSFCFESANKKPKTQR